MWEHIRWYLCACAPIAWWLKMFEHTVKWVLECTVMDHCHYRKDWGNGVVRVTYSLICSLTPTDYVCAIEKKNENICNEWNKNNNNNSNKKAFVASAGMQFSNVKCLVFKWNYIKKKKRDYSSFNEQQTWTYRAHEMCSRFIMPMRSIHRCARQIQRDSQHRTTTTTTE